jgi:uncharacterized membrane protein YfhO
LVVNSEAVHERSQLLLTLPADPGWQVTVNGERAEVTARYGALLAVDLPPGLHTVDLQYVPKGFFFGLSLSGASLLITLGWAFGPRLIKRGVKRK